MKWLVGIVLVLVALFAWIRSSADPAVWHQKTNIQMDQTLPGGVQRRLVSAADNTLKRLDAIIRQAPRTTQIAGSVAQGMVTYVTRSAVVGFPDYTTLWHDSGDIYIHARLRFGRSDLGVNQARVDGWLAELAAQPE